MDLPIVLIGEDSPQLAALCQQIEEKPGFAVETWARSFVEGSAYLRGKTDPTLVIIDLGWHPQKTLPVAEELKLRLPHIRLVMTAPANDPETILGALRAGAEEFLAQPFDHSEVLQSLERIRQKVDLQIAKSRERGRTIAVFSSKGGSGSTTVATNLAAALAFQKKSVCIVDMAGQSGSVTTFLNLATPGTGPDPWRSLDALDAALLQASLISHSSGVKVLTGPMQGGAAKIDPHRMERILDTLMQSFDFVVVDSPKELDEVSLTVLDRAHLILSVTGMDVPSLRSTHRALETFARLGIFEKKVRLVLNRYVKSRVMSLELTEQTLGVNVFWTVPNDYPSALTAVTRGLPVIELSRTSALAKSYYGLAEAVIASLRPGTGQVEKKEKAPSLFGRWISFPGALKGEVS